MKLGRHTHVRVPNGAMSKLMRTSAMRPYRRGTGSSGGPPASAFIAGHYLFNDDTVTTSDGTSVTAVSGEKGPTLTSGGAVFDYYPAYQAVDGQGGFDTDILTAAATFPDGEKYSFFAVASVQAESPAAPNQSMGIGCWRDATTGADAGNLGMISPDNSQAKLRMHGLDGVTSSTQDYPKDGTRFAFGFAMAQNGGDVNAWFSMGDEVIEGSSNVASNPASAIALAGQAATPFMIHEVIWYDRQVDVATGNEIMAYLKANHTMTNYGALVEEFAMTIAYNAGPDQYGYDDRVPMGSVDPVAIRPGNNIRYFLVAADDRVYFKTQDIVDAVSDVIIELTLDTPPALGVSQAIIEATWDGSIYFSSPTQTIDSLYEFFADNNGADLTVRMYVNPSP